MKPLAITGVGVISPLGLGHEALRDGFRDPDAARARAFGGEPTVLERDKFPEAHAAECWDFDANEQLGQKGHRNFDRLTKYLIVAAKQPLPQWLALDQAREHCRAGASEWDWAGSPGGGEPDVVLAASGTVPTIETLAAARMLREDAPELAVRVVNVTDLLVMAAPDLHPHGLSEDDFEASKLVSRSTIAMMQVFCDGPSKTCKGRMLRSLAIAATTRPISSLLMSAARGSSTCV